MIAHLYCERLSIYKNNVDLMHFQINNINWRIMVWADPFYKKKRKYQFQQKCCMHEFVLTVRTMTWLPTLGVLEGRLLIFQKRL